MESGSKCLKNTTLIQSLQFDSANRYVSTFNGSKVQIVLVITVLM